MSKEYLDFEKPAAVISEKITELKEAGHHADINLAEEIERLKNKEKKLIKQTFARLTAQQIVQLARHPERPYSLDYIPRIFDDFQELCGDRHTGNCHAIVAGIATLENQGPVMIIAQEKGRTINERLKRNFGMAQPEGYRKALRIMRLAEKFRIPIITLIDTQGAYPGIQAERNNQSEAIARNLYEMPNLKVPIISVVIGEGCSGGALAIGVADVIAMLQYSIYTTISPEGCASILWKDTTKASIAADAMCLTADKLKENNLVDHILEEPLGSAHRDVDLMANNIKNFLIQTLRHLSAKTTKTLLEERYHKLMMHHLHESHET